MGGCSYFKEWDFSGGSLAYGCALGFVVPPACVLPCGQWSSDLNNVLGEY